MDQSEGNKIHHILLLDDEPSVRLALKLLLQAIGFEVTDFSEPLEAVNFLAQGQRADLFICDLRMPTLSGIQVLEQAKSIAPEVRFVLMSAHAHDAELARAYDLGADGVLSKPFTPVELEELIKRLGGT